MGYVGITLLSTTYFGWHYIADDIAGAVIAFISFYLGGIATGQKFDEHGRHSHPTTTTSDVPVDAEESPHRGLSPALARRSALRRCWRGWCDLVWRPFR